MLILRVLGDLFRSAGTAHMRVKTNNPVRFGHYHMQIVGNHQDAAIVFIANVGDKLVKRHLAGIIDPCTGSSRTSKSGWRTIARANSTR